MRFRNNGDIQVTILVSRYRHDISANDYFIVDNEYFLSLLGGFNQRNGGRTSDVVDNCCTDVGT